MNWMKPGSERNRVEQRVAGEEQIVGKAGVGGSLSQATASCGCPSSASVLAVPEGPRTTEGLRHNIRVGIQYLEAWLRGHGCVPLYDLMEDAATAEISRAQVWQWLHPATPRRRAAHQRALRRRSSTKSLAGLRPEASSPRRASSSTRSCSHDRFEEFLTLPAYEQLEGDRIMSAAVTLSTFETDRLVPTRDRFERNHAAVHEGRRRAPARLDPGRAHARAARRRASLGAAPRRSRTSPRSAR